MEVSKVVDAPITVTLHHTPYPFSLQHMGCVLDGSAVFAAVSPECDGQPESAGCNTAQEPGPEVRAQPQWLPCDRCYPQLSTQPRELQAGTQGHQTLG